jgi:hypothetical protein
MHPNRFFTGLWRTHDDAAGRARAGPTSPPAPDDRPSIRARADAVRRALLDLSFPEDRLRIVSFSYCEPMCATPDDLCRQKDRRVHFGAAKPFAGAEGEKR